MRGWDGKVVTFVIGAAIIAAVVRPNAFLGFYDTLAHSRTQVTQRCASHSPMERLGVQPGHQVQNVYYY